ncbi:MAG: CBS domain-containing protein [Actinomycetota bacterium]|nr:CBS domain-containing protein [Actinomycetota bacterium]
MPQSIRDVMTPSPRAMDARASVQEAAKAMLDDDIGDVIVCDGDTVCGIVTDRDITIRTVAHGKDPAATKLGEICSEDLTSLSLGDTVDDAVRLMREKAIRRIPVLDDGKPVGVVSIGDLAIDLDADSALADISKASANT